MRALAYTKSEVALLYFPGENYKTARRRLFRWIRHCRPLHASLLELGYRQCQRRFTVKQVEEIFRYLGEPS